MSYTAITHDSVFGPTYRGVPNPYHVILNRYPTRFHGASYVYPDTQEPTYRENPLEVPVKLAIGLGADMSYHVFQAAAGFGVNPDGIGADIDIAAILEKGGLTSGGGSAAALPTGGSVAQAFEQLMNQSGGSTSIGPLPTSNPWTKTPAVGPMVTPVPVAPVQPTVPTTPPKPAPSSGGGGIFGVSYTSIGIVGAIAVLAAVAVNQFKKGSLGKARVGKK